MQWLAAHSVAYSADSEDHGRAAVGDLRAVVPAEPTHDHRVVVVVRLERAGWRSQPRVCAFGFRHTFW